MDNSFSRYVDEAAAGTLMRNVYLWMSLALAITAGTAWVAANSYGMMMFFFGGGSMLPFYALCGVELILVIALSAAINRISLTAATLLFVLYSMVNGLTMSYIFLIYEISSIATTFLVCALDFGAMALIGSFTKKDLSAIGRFGLMALIGLIIASIVNMFLKNEMMDFVISGIGVLLFTGLTAYDAQKIKLMFAEADDANESMQKYALLGSLTLYLDFINLFLYLLRFLGKRK